MREKPLLSVIVPVYKVEKYLPKCVSSIRNQTSENLEILLVDDGSPDGCPALCDQYGAEDTRIRVIHKENEGQALARNRALDLCRGQYVTFVDSDDYLETDAYRQMLEAMEKTGARTACCGRYDVEEATGEKIPGLCPSREEVLDPEEMLRRMFTWQNCDCSPCDKIFAKELFSDIRFPSRSGCEDIAILYKLILAGNKTVMIPKAFYNYVQRSGSTSYGTVNEKTFQYEEYTRELYRDICRDHPGVRPEASFLRIRSFQDRCFFWIRRIRQ